MPVKWSDSFQLRDRGRITYFSSLSLSSHVGTMYWSCSRMVLVASDICACLFIYLEKDHDAGIFEKIKQHISMLCGNVIDMVL